MIVCAASRQAHIWLQVANHEPSDNLLGAQMLEGDLLGQHLPQDLHKMDIQPLSGLSMCIRSSLMSCPQKRHICRDD